MPICDHDCDRFKNLNDLTWGEFNIDDADLEQIANGQSSAGYGDFDKRSHRSSRDMLWFLPDLCTGGDYSGDLVHKSNFRSLLRLCKEALNDTDTCTEPWFVELEGGHGTFAIALHCERTPEDVYEKIEGLSNYPLLDENDYSELQHEEEGEAWSNWASQDFKRALEKKFPNYDFDEMSDDDLYELFHKAMESSNTYWETEGMGVSVSLDRIVGDIEATDLPGQKGWKMDDDLNGLRRPKTSGRMQMPAWVRRKR